LLDIIRHDGEINQHVSALSFWIPENPTQPPPPSVHRHGSRFRGNSLAPSRPPWKGIVKEKKSLKGGLLAAGHALHVETLRPRCPSVGASCSPILISHDDGGRLGEGSDRSPAGERVLGRPSEKPDQDARYPAHG